MSVQDQPSLRPDIRRFKLGAFQVTSLLDGASVRQGLTPSFGGDAHANDVRALAAANRIDTDRYEAPFTPLLVETGTARILFDTGNGTLAKERAQFSGRLPPGRLTHLLERIGVRPDSIDTVVLTHGHPDHIGGLMTGGSPTFRNASYVIGAAEFDFWKKGENVREARVANRALFMDLVVPLADRARFVKPGDAVAPGITAVDAAGHSPGMLAFLIESEGKRLLNWADTGGHYVVSLQRPDLHLDVDDDKDKAVGARRRVFDMAASEDMFVMGYHMPFAGVGSVERVPGAAYRWVPIAYQLND